MRTTCTNLFSAAVALFMAVEIWTWCTQLQLRGLWRTGIGDKARKCVYKSLGMQLKQIPRTLSGCLVDSRVLNRVESLYPLGCKNTSVVKGEEIRQLWLGSKHVDFMTMITKQTTNSIQPLMVETCFSLGLMCMWCHCNSAATSSCIISFGKNKSIHLKSFDSLYAIYIFKLFIVES